MVVLIILIQKNTLNLSFSSIFSLFRPELSWHLAIKLYCIIVYCIMIMAVMVDWALKPSIYLSSLFHEVTDSDCLNIILIIKQIEGRRSRCCFVRLKC